MASGSSTACRCRRTGLVVSAFLVGLALASAALAQQVVPRFEPGQCSFSPGASFSSVRLECGQLVVWQIRDRPAAGTLRLAVAIVHPQTPSTEPPLVLLHGGPSGPGGLRGGEMSAAPRLASTLKRDVIVYDQRGAGASEPTLCPERLAEPSQAGNIADRERRQAAWNADARACVASLKAHGLDPSTFNTITNAADAIDLRTTLKYAQWDVFGVSYGSRLVQELMRRDPRGVRSAVMNSPVQPGPGQEAEVPLAFQRVLDHTFASCAAQPACAGAFPTLTKDFYELWEELNARPIDVEIQSTTSTVTVKLDADRLIRALHNRFTRNASRMPLYIHELRSGDRVGAARVLLSNAAAGASNNTLTDLVGCYESGGPVYQDVLASVALQLRPQFRSLLNTEEECAFWSDRFAGPSERGFVQSDIPTLILTNEFDDRTPTEYARRIAVGLTNARVIELPGLTHGQMSPCAEAIVVSFFEHPTRTPDTTCMARMPPLMFETRNLVPITLILDIASDGSTPNPFSGRWEAGFPDAPVTYQVRLTIAGTGVTGTIGGGAQEFQVFDGRVDGTTVVFKVKSGDGARTITFTGELNGDRLAFTRRVDVPPGAPMGGAGLFGAGGAREFTATRVK